MPKYEVFIREIEVFKISVSAEDKLEAAKVALKIHGESFRSHDGYDELGEDDDAALVSQELYDEFLKEFEGAGGEQHPHFIDLETDEVKPDFIGRKWLVVVDYHS